MLVENLELTFQDNFLVFTLDCGTSYDDVYYLQYAKKGQDKWFTLKITTKTTILYEMHQGIHIGDKFRVVAIRNAEFRFKTNSVTLSITPVDLETTDFIPDHFQKIMSQVKIDDFKFNLRAYFINNVVAFKVDTSDDELSYTYTLQYHPKTVDRWYTVCDFKESMYKYHLPYITQVGDRYRCVIKRDNAILHKSNEISIIKPYETEIALDATRTKNTMRFTISGRDAADEYFFQYRRSGSADWKDICTITDLTFSYELPPETTRVGDGYRCVVKENNLIKDLTNEISIRAPYEA